MLVDLGLVGSSERMQHSCVGMNVVSEEDGGMEEQRGRAESREASMEAVTEEEEAVMEEGTWGGCTCQREDAGGLERG